MAIVRWEPFREMISLKDAIDRLFEDSFAKPWRLWPDQLGRELPIDMYQTASEVVVRAALPGVKPEEVDISITGDTLTIKGEHKEEQEIREEDYFCKECHHGSFSRSVTIPVQVQSDKAEAVFEDGILTLRLPKAEEIKPKQIKVKT
ncbi:MAG TPA: Hsp20/alpha crystallin family protein [Dehalococcoidia bacterium]|jgi:HSP20 family protein|nr:Hsp20/alpha crystallin family protein [Dehalococcoidia bacterium]